MTMTTMPISDIEKAKRILDAQGYTCVLCKGELLYHTTLRGVKPLVAWLESGNDFAGFSAADRVVGRATAFLYSLLDVSAVYAHVMSRSALEVLNDAGIQARYGTLVEYIINRKGDGICPFEAAVLDVHNPEQARIAIRRKMEQMNITLD